jgi:lambda family phage portal protein
VVKAFVRNVVGIGFTLQAKVTTAGGKDDETVNAAIEAEWAEWCRARNCDIQGRQSLAEMCRMAVRRMRVDGGILFVKSYTPGGTAPLVLQMREVDELDTTMMVTKLDNGYYVVDGIEVDAYGKHIAYYFKQFSPDGFATLDPVRVTADRVIYLQEFKRPSQPREMSPMTPGLTRIRDTNEYMTAVSVQARVAACFGAIIKKMTPGMAGLGRGIAGSKTDSQTGYAGQTMTPGMMMYLQPGEDVTSLNPPAMGSSVKDMLGIQQRLVGAGQGIGYETASRDMSQVNYSSARQGLLEDREEYRELQQYLIEHLLREVYTSWLISAALIGRLPFTVAELLGDKARYMAHAFIGKGWSWIDPFKEAKANEVSLNTGQDTLQRICAEQGLDWREVIAQRGRELQAMQDAGITPIGGGSNGGNAAAGAAGGS